MTFFLGFLVGSAVTLFSMFVGSKVLTKKETFAAPKVTTLAAKRTTRKKPKIQDDTKAWQSENKDAWQSSDTAV